MVWAYGVDMPVRRVLFEVRFQVPTQFPDDGQLLLFVRVVTLADPGVYGPDTRSEVCLVGTPLHHGAEVP